MERLDIDGRPVKRLSAWFERPEPAPSIATAPVGPTPRELLELERAQVFAQAREAGHAEGMRRADEAIREASAAARRDCEAAHADALKALETTRGQLADVVRSIPDRIASIEAETMDLAAELAFEALLRILGQMDRRERMLALCRQALAEHPRRPVVLRLAEADAQALASMPDTPGVRVEPDSALHPGQCQLATTLGSVDTGLDVRLELMCQAFLRSLDAGRLAR